MRPDHLFLGTPADNAADTKAKGRVRTNPRLGSRHPMAKLDEARVAELRDRYGRLPRGPAGKVLHGHLAALCRDYGVSTSAVHAIIHRQTWKEIP